MIETVIFNIEQCKEFNDTDKDIIIRFLKRYQLEPQRTQVNFNPNGNSLSEIINFNKTREGSAFWSEVVNIMNIGRLKGQLQITYDSITSD